MYDSVVVPAVDADTKPEVRFIVAFETLLLVQVPPGAAFENRVVVPVHIKELPTLGDKAGLTVIVLVLAQPLLFV
jgi:hypothetical protein